MDPEILQQMIDAGLVEDRSSILAQQMKRAQGLMATPGASGTNVGGTYVAASPLEHLAGAMARVMGGQQIKGAERGMRDLIGQKGAARMAYAQGAGMPSEAPAMPAPTQAPQIPQVPPMLARPADQAPAWSAPEFAPQSPASLPTPGAPAPPALVAPKSSPNLSPGALAALSGDPAIMAAGKAQTDEAARQANMALQGRHLDAQLAQHADQMAHENAALEESRRHSLETERNQRALLGGGGSALTGDALDMAATLYARTGQLPSLGRNVAGRTAIIARAAELFPGSDVAANKATLHSDSNSLAALQKQVDAVNAFERTALANLDRFEQEAGKTIDLGSPLANKPGRWLAENAGDPQVTRFNVARQVAVNEIGKILSGSMGNGGLSDSARQEVEHLLASDASLAQLKGAADLLRQDMHNRRTAYQAELDNVRTRMGGRLTAGGPPAAEPAPVEALPRKVVGGKTYEKRADGWYEVQ